MTWDITGCLLKNRLIRWKEVFEAELNHDTSSTEIADHTFETAKRRGIHKLKANKISENGLRELFKCCPSSFISQLQQTHSLVWQKK